MARVDRHGLPARLLLRALLLLCVVAACAGGAKRRRRRRKPNAAVSGAHGVGADATVGADADLGAPPPLLPPPPHLLDVQGLAFPRSHSWPVRFAGRKAQEMFGVAGGWRKAVALTPAEVARALKDASAERAALAVTPERNPNAASRPMPRTLLLCRGA